MKYILSGFLVKAVTGFDDTIAQIPLLGSITKSRLGRIAFAIGILLAISIAIGFSVMFASILRNIPYFRYIAAGLIFILALCVYFKVFVHKQREEAEKEIKATKRILSKRFLKLLGIGFIAGFATVIDDTVAYSSLFLEKTTNALYPIIGIYLAVIIELSIIIYFSKKVAKFKWKRQIATIGLIILSLLVLFNVL
jgi:hypothetical protein